VSTSSPLTIVAITTAVAGKENALRAAQEKLVAETVMEPGCLSYELNQALDVARVLIFTKRWASERKWRSAAVGESEDLLIEPIARLGSNCGKDRFRPAIHCFHK
jgi:hypothetical protein